MTTQLLKEGAKLSAPDRFGRTPLMAAAIFNANPAVTETLLRAGADIEAQDSDGLTPRMAAAWHNPNANVIATLLKAHANIAAVAKNGLTVLFVAAARTQNPEVITTLLKAGAGQLKRPTRSDSPDVRSAVKCKPTTSCSPCHERRGKWTLATNG